MIFRGLHLMTSVPTLPAKINKQTKQNKIKNTKDKTKNKTKKTKENKESIDFRDSLPRRDIEQGKSRYVLGNSACSLVVNHP